MLVLTPEDVQKELDALPPHYKTKDVDRLIARYARQKADASALEPYVLARQQLHRIYYYVSLRQLKDVGERMRFIDAHMHFADWWHTDQLINFVRDLPFETALTYAKSYLLSEDAFVRRWGYVLFISKLGHGHAEELLPLMQDDEEYYVQMAQAWLIAELAVFEPEAVFDWMQADNTLSYHINGKAIRKICDSFRISAQWKQRFKSLRIRLKNRT